MQLIPMILNGTAPLYLLSTMYVVAGALLGAPAGVEFTAAIQAAEQVCHSCCKGMIVYAIQSWSPEYIACIFKGRNP